MKRADLPKGFTLVEVLVALLVLALAMAAWQLRISSQLDSAGYLRDKTLAEWVALNQLHYLQLLQRLGQQPLPGQSGTAALAGRTFYWQASPLPQLADKNRDAGSSSLEQAPQPVVIGVSAESIEAARQNPQARVTGVLDAKPVL